MRTKKPFLIALFLCTWTFLSYYLLIRQTDSGNNGNYATRGMAHARHRDDLFLQLNRLETNIQEENVIHDQLVKKLIEIVRLKEREEDGHGNLASYKNYTLYNVANGIISDTKDANRVPDVNIDNALKGLNTETKSTDSDAPLINKLKGLNKRTLDFKGPIIPVLVFACNRISVRNCLDDLVRYRPNSYQFPIIVSQVSFHTFFSINYECCILTSACDDETFHT